VHDAIENQQVPWQNKSIDLCGGMLCKICKLSTSAEKMQPLINAIDRNLIAEGKISPWN